MKFITLLLSALLLIEGYSTEDVNSGDLVKVLDSLGYSSQSWVVSPASIRSALEQLYIGSDGKTKTQLKSALSISNDFDIYNEQTKLNVKPGKGVEWSSANRILVRNNFPLKSSYQSRLSSIFHTDVISSDFKNPDDLANSVNSWVSQETHDHIKNLVDSESVADTETMLILNAVYFKGTWKYAFDHEATQLRCFNTKPGNCKNTNMMKQRAHFNYGQFDDLGAQIIQLPYNNSDGLTSYSMVIVLPTEQDGLSAVVQKFSQNILVEKMNSLFEEEVILSMPKFKTEFNINLNKPLKMMGLSSIFTDKADFSGISNVTGLYVSEVTHKAYIDVEEKGTIAAAATAVHVNGMMPMMPPPVYTFTADHPFIYFIMMDNTEILFAGQYTGF